MSSLLSSNDSSSSSSSSRSSAGIPWNTIRDDHVRGFPIWSYRSYLRRVGSWPLDFKDSHALKSNHIARSDRENFSTIWYDNLKTFTTVKAISRVDY